MPKLTQHALQGVDIMLGGPETLPPGISAPDTVKVLHLIDGLERWCVPLEAGAVEYLKKQLHAGLHVVGAGANGGPLAG